METLHRLKVLITRPEHQAKKLASDIQAHAGIPIFFPTIEIVPTDNTMLISEVFKKIDHYDFVIFISPNAVLQSASYIHHFWPSWPKKTKIMAIGPGTEATLKILNLSVDYRPEKDFNSEGLLALPPLQSPKQKKILICQGENGCLSLINTLEKRSANVNTLNLYKRSCPRLITNNIPNSNEIDIIICTSNTGLKNLVNLLQADWHDVLFDKQLLVISLRIAEFAEKLGFVKAPLISDNASNEAILNTLSRWEKEIWSKNRQSSPPPS
ncbi:uroporphyrinogen-III synthase [Candidatus Rickettsiella viridis]|uniref:Uroporphyrinogen-III synthase n=1 Tax=Candidatus Rickettsiella viridis TaxID=676208 RepID=A0A2Z5UUN8_9COXI|nr:uroporphyrinogen-III synthase [Candidatus Rickettsiella viridis]BBB14711.1 uroporphyrinogen-III synthase [Candidatus Rickettsiella viridis]